MSSAAGAAAKSRRLIGRLSSSRVRMEMTQATSCWNGVSKPRSASSNIAALGYGSTACAMRSTATSTSNGLLPSAVSTVISWRGGRYAEGAAAAPPEGGRTKDGERSGAAPRLPHPPLERSDPPFPLHERRHHLRAEQLDRLFVTA